MPKQQPGWVKSTTTKNQLTVTWRDPKELIMYAKNSKLHPPEQIQQIANSITEFGFLDPIAIDENGEILEGHGRYLAAVDILNLKSVPTFQVLGLTEEQKIAYRVAHNKLTMNTDFDPDLLKIDMDFLNEMSFDLTLTGFDSEDLSSYLSLETTEYEKPEKQENTIIDDATDKENTEELLEEVVENKIVSRVKLGEIWQLGRHKIACGDSTIESNVKALLGDRFDGVGMVWADPPYGINVVSTNGYVGGGECNRTSIEDCRAKRFGTIGGSKAFGSKDVRGSNRNSNVVKVNSYAPIIGDDTIDTAVKSYQLASFLSGKAVHIWWGANYYANYLPSTSCWIVWDKENTGNFADAELAWCSNHSAVRIFKHRWNGMIKASEHGEKRVHPTQKPVALCEWAFEKYGSSDDLIFDPFLGSAPSIIAAQKMEGNRTVYGFELSPDYCEVIIQRFEKLTGIEAKLLGKLPTAPNNDTKSDDSLDSLGF